MHNQMSDGPQRPADRQRPQLTAPSMDCLEDDERMSVAKAGADLIGAIRSGVPALFELAMDNMVALGAHLTGHTLQNLIWASFQTKLVHTGQPPHDAPEAMVMIDPGDPAQATEATYQDIDMVKSFMEGTLGGAHASAMDAWASWVDQVGNDWERYTFGVANLMGQAVFILHADASEGTEIEDAVMGGRPSMKFTEPGDREF